MSIFSGSYAPEDVHFLLKPIEVESTSLWEKERLIQQKNYHYSEMITHESLPSSAYLALFHATFTQNKPQLAHDLITLALEINQRKQGEIVLISLARAGTPIGVLLKRILQRYFKRQCQHYSISIIRDRGIDYNALQYILDHHANVEGFTFIDGWTGKGVITQELHQSVLAFNQQFHTAISPDLYVLNDIAGVAAVTASFDDYLIPSSLLNSIVSGLISRSILNKKYISTGDFHGCLYYQHFLATDLSRWFVDQTMIVVDEKLMSTQKNFKPDKAANLKTQTQQQSSLFIQQIKKTYNIQNINLIKPGIGEATRVLLRRVPDCLILKNRHGSQTQHLSLLAEEKQITMIENPQMPYQATAIIKEMIND
ncbi:MAG: cysteine protease StiP family protein [Methylococcales bacterium]|nr:cysteine protease StiP family protein [Methylococcales bacterium]MCK5924516.1 cysteine protease StiP family protein [Methylococcales bacterium]